MPEPVEGDMHMFRLAFAGLSVALYFCQAAYAESTTNKCTDGKRITYANMPCEKLGLKAIGPVKETVVVVPAIQIPKKNSGDETGKADKAKDDTKASGSDDASEADVPRTEKIKPVNPLIERMLK